MNKISIAISVAALLMYGCSDKPKEDKSVKTQKTQSADKTASSTTPKSIYGASAQKELAQAPSETDAQLNTPHMGKVMETMNGGGYTYAKVNENGNVYWIAGPQSEVVVGSTISYIEQMVMTDFTSKALKRTFDQLVFVSAIVSPNSSAKTATKENPHKNHNHGAESKHEAISTPIKVAKNADGYSVEELYAKKAKLKDKGIKLNAKVVKLSKNIMGKDWIHLQDGSGSAGTNDIIATSANSTVSVGDVVTVDGVIKTDIDLGYGYKFAVIIEKAKLSLIK